MPEPTPSQTVGPFFSIGLCRDPGEAHLASPDDPNAIRIRGRVIDGEDNGVNDAVVEIFQPDSSGRYCAQGEDGFSSFGRCGTNDDGEFEFVTVKPGVPPDSPPQAPHIEVQVFARGLLKQLFTRIYFPDEEANASDPLLSAIDDPAERETLIARPEGDRVLRFDVRLQGEGQTVFFAV